MRIKEEINQTGYFWLPSNPDWQVPGTLKIIEGGDIELEIIGMFEDDPMKALDNSMEGNMTIGRIIGNVEKSGYVLLEDCVYKKQVVSFGGVAKSPIRVGFAFAGVHCEGDEPILFDDFRFSVEGIDEWVGISGIKVAFDPEKLGASITFTPPQEISFQLDNGLKLEITFRSTLPSPSLSEAKITQKTFFRLSSGEPLPLKGFIEPAHKIVHLLGFAVDQTVCLESVAVRSSSFMEENGKGRKLYMPIDVYYASLPYTETKPKIGRHQMLFDFAKVRQDAHRIVNNWLKAYKEISPALNLYFATKAGVHKFLDGKFLALTQGLETYHRRTSDETMMEKETYRALTKKLVEQCPEENRDWLSNKLAYANELSLKDRLTRIIRPFEDLFGSEKEQKTLIRRIVDTRNFLTHYDTRLEKVAAKQGDMLELCYRMEAIFQLHILQVLGFTPEEIRTVFSNSYKLRQKAQKKLKSKSSKRA